MTSEMSTATVKSFASSSSHLKKSVFRYKAQLGHVPGEAESFLYVKRTDPKTHVTKIIPELVYPILANRSAVPKHALLEDDWRAYRSVLHNYQTLMWSQMDPVTRMKEYFRWNDMASMIYKSLARELKKPPSAFVPVLDMYQNSVDAPLGYMYRRYKQGGDLPDKQSKPGPGKQQLRVPELLFEGPFMDKVQISQGRWVKEQWDQEMNYYDADVIMTSSKRPKMYIYNEPDTIPLSCARTDFSLPLSQRAKNMAGAISTKFVPPLCC